MCFAAKDQIGLASVSALVRMTVMVMTMAVGMIVIMVVILMRMAMRLILIATILRRQTTSFGVTCHKRFHCGPKKICLRR